MLQKINFLNRAGTDTPPFQELKDKGPPPYQTSLSTYDQIVVATSATLKITNLKASMNYTISFYVEDQLEITNGPYNLIFQTLGKVLFHLFKKKI